MKTLEEFISSIPDTVEAMKGTPQNPVYHGEGDVWTHTQLVMDELHKLEEYKGLSFTEKNVLNFACLLHDVGKTVCTKLVDGELQSHGHARLGAGIARRLLWDAGFCGKLMDFRESVCALIRMHGKPPHPLSEQEIQRLSLLTPASQYNMKLLYILSKADWNGRVCATKEEGDIFIELFREYAKDMKCLGTPWTPDAYSRHAFLCWATYSPSYKLYNSTWGEVTIMSGLPASGKTTWVSRHRAKLPVVSLDEIRRRKGISPTDNQGVVVQCAVDEAKEHLRNHQPFVWDATCLNPDMRKKIVGLAMDYQAFANIVYIETDDEDRLERNRRREYSVPEDVMDKMKSKVEPPLYDEAHDVNWVC